MRKEKNSMGISVGGSSILVTFVVLCLTSLATLSLVLARADYKLTQKTAQAATEFYVADAKAEMYLQKLKATFEYNGTTNQSGKILFDDIEVSYDSHDSTAVLSYEVAINDIKNLHVEVGTDLNSDGKPVGNFKRLCWKVELVKEWQDEGHINLAEFGNIPKFK